MPDAKTEGGWGREKAERRWRLDRMDRMDGIGWKKRGGSPAGIHPADSSADANISRYGDKILCFFSIDGTMGVAGAIPALKSAGLFKPKSDPKHIPVATIDGTEEEFEAARRGDLDFFIDNGKLDQGRMAMRALYEWMNKNWDDMPKVGEPLWPEYESLRQPYVIVDGKTQEPSFEGYIYSFRNLCFPLDMDANSKEGWGNAYYHAINGKWPWE